MTELDPHKYSWDPDHVVWGGDPETAEKCLSCGCGRPHDDHGDVGTITLEDLIAAAEASDIPPGLAASNIASGYRDMTEKATAALIADILKVGAEGFIHGWICVRPPCGKVGDQIAHPLHGLGTISGTEEGKLHGEFEDGVKGTLGISTNHGPGPHRYEAAPAKVSTVAAANRHSRAYTDAQIRDLQNQINRMQAELHSSEHKDARTGLALDLGATLAAVLLVFMVGPMGLAALIPILADKGPDIVKAVVDYAKTRGAHTENILTPLKPGEKSDDPAAELTAWFEKEFTDAGVDPALASRVAAAIVQSAQAANDSDRKPWEPGFIPSGNWDQLLSQAPPVTKRYSITITPAQLAAGYGREAQP